MGTAIKFRFTIRDLLWLMIVIALAVAWWTEHQRAAKVWQQAVERERVWNRRAWEFNWRPWVEVEPLDPSPLETPSLPKPAFGPAKSKEPMSKPQ